MMLSHTQPLRFIRWEEFGEHRKEVMVGRMKLDLRIGCLLLAPPARAPYPFYVRRNVYDAMASRLNRFDLITCDYRTFHTTRKDPLSGYSYPCTYHVILQIRKHQAVTHDDVERWSNTPLVKVIE